MLFCFVSACPSSFLSSSSPTYLGIFTPRSSHAHQNWVCVLHQPSLFHFSHQRIAGKHSLVKHGPGSGGGVAVANGGICKEFSLGLVPLRVAKSTLSWYPPSLPRSPSLVEPPPPFFLHATTHFVWVQPKANSRGGDTSTKVMLCIPFVSLVLFYCIFPLLCTCPLKMPCFVM